MRVLWVSIFLLASQGGCILGVESPSKGVQRSFVSMEDDHDLQSVYNLYPNFQSSI